MLILDNIDLGSVYGIYSREYRLEQYNVSKIKKTYIRLVRNKRRVVVLPCYSGCQPYTVHVTIFFILFTTKSNVNLLPVCLSSITVLTST